MARGKWKKSYDKGMPYHAFSETQRTELQEDHPNCNNPQDFQWMRDSDPPDPDFQRMEKIVLGHKFIPMTSLDWEGFSGADEGSLICHTRYCTLILSPNGMVSEITECGDQIDWVHEDFQ